MESSCFALSVIERLSFQAVPNVAGRQLIIYLMLYSGAIIAIFQLFLTLICSIIHAPSAVVRLNISVLTFDLFFQRSDFWSKSFLLNLTPL